MTNPTPPQSLDELLEEINIDYACRALMGFGKGLAVMQALLATDPEYHKKIVEKAKQRLKEQTDGDLSDV